jgi:hypothetical protein
MSLLKPNLNPFHAFLIGAGCGVLLLILLGHLMYLDKARGVELGRLAKTDLSLSRQEDLLHYYLIPAMVGVVVGGLIGWAVWVTRASRRVPLGLLVLSWSWLGLVLGFLIGSGILVALMAPTAGSVGRTGVPSLVVLQVPVLAIAGLIAGYLIGVLKARARKRQWDAASKRKVAE